MNDLAVVLVLGLASYRATQLVVWDSIGDGLRLRLKVWRARKEGSRVRAFLDKLIGCPYCTGWWLSLITTGAYMTAAGRLEATWSSWFTAALMFWAVAGVQALLNRWDDTRSDNHDHEGD